MPSFLQRVTRRKFVTFDDSELTRVLTFLDLTLLGVGSTVGVGFYILAGAVARDIAGPAVVISFLIAGIASVFAGLCYAEFGARVPKAGSAYIYSYVCVGEFISFVIGWNLILEYVIGTASVARGYSAYIDELANNKISTGLENAMPIDVSFLSPYPDFFAFTITIVLTFIVGFGVKASTRFNNVFTCINIFVVLYVCIAGLFLVNTNNWALTEEEVGYDGANATVCIEEKYSGDSDWGKGGFAPYGFEGIMQGAATCFFGFVGFDVIATTGEEALNPTRNIPMAIATSLFIVFLAYFGMSAILTLALAYCLQDPGAPLIYLFDYYEMMPSKWIVSTGAVFGFSASLLGTIFPMPRIIYAMASDGLLFRFLSKVNKRFQTPFLATMLSGFFAACMALIFSLESLIDMMSIGTLLAYTIVALCVMLLRYSEETGDTGSDQDSGKFQQGDFFKERQSVFSVREYTAQMFNGKSIQQPNELTSSFVSYATISFAFIALLFDILLVQIGRHAYNGDAWSITLLSIVALLAIFNAFVIARQPESKKKLSFKVPFVPWIPAISTVINLYLMCNLSSATWIRFGCWMVIGLLIYFLYGIRESGEGMRQRALHGGYQDLDVKKPFRKESFIPEINILPPTPLQSKTGTPQGSIAQRKVIEKSVLARVAMANVALQMEGDVGAKLEVKEDGVWDDDEVIDGVGKIEGGIKSDAVFVGLHDDGGKKVEEGIWRKEGGVKSGVVIATVHNDTDRKFEEEMQMNEDVIKSASVFDKYLKDDNISVETHEKENGIDNRAYKQENDDDDIASSIFFDNDETAVDISKSFNRQTGIIDDDNAFQDLTKISDMYPFEKLDNLRAGEDPVVSDTPVKEIPSKSKIFYFPMEERTVSNDPLNDNVENKFEDSSSGVSSFISSDTSPYGDKQGLNIAHISNNSLTDVIDFDSGRPPILEKSGMEMLNKNTTDKNLTQISKATNLTLETDVKGRNSPDSSSNSPDSSSNSSAISSNFSDGSVADDHFATSKPKSRSRSSLDDLETASHKRIGQTKSLPESSDNGQSASLPGSPLSKRHPFKPFKRVASFESIPPSTPDSPGAKRLSLGSRRIFVIPVNDAMTGNETAGSTPINPNSATNNPPIILNNPTEKHKPTPSGPPAASNYRILPQKMFSELNNRLSDVKLENEPYEIDDSAKYHSAELDTIKERRESVLSTDSEGFSRSSSTVNVNGRSPLDRGHSFRSTGTRLSARKMKPREEDIMESVQHEGKSRPTI